MTNLFKFLSNIILNFTSIFSGGLILPGMTLTTHSDQAPRLKKEQKNKFPLFPGPHGLF
jgi:pantothenate kinase type III